MISLISDRYNDIFRKSVICWSVQTVSVNMSLRLSSVLNCRKCVEVQTLISRSIGNGFAAIIQFLLISL